MNKDNIQFTRDQAFNTVNASNVMVEANTPAVVNSSSPPTPEELKLVFEELDNIRDQRKEASWEREKDSFRQLPKWLRLSLIGIFASIVGWLIVLLAFQSVAKLLLTHIILLINAVFTLIVVSLMFLIDLRKSKRSNMELIGERALFDLEAGLRVSQIANQQTLKSAEIKIKSEIDLIQARGTVVSHILKSLNASLVALGLAQGLPAIYSGNIPFATFIITILAVSAIVINGIVELFLQRQIIEYKEELSVLEQAQNILSSCNSSMPSQPSLSEATQPNKRFERTRNQHAS